MVPKNLKPINTIMIGIDIALDYWGCWDKTQHNPIPRPHGEWNWCYGGLVGYIHNTLSIQAPQGAVHIDFMLNNSLTKEEQV